MKENLEDKKMEVVGIWVKDQIMCIRCAGVDQIAQVVEKDKIWRHEVEEDSELNYCDSCCNPLI